MPLATTLRLLAKARGLSATDLATAIPKAGAATVSAWLPQHWQPTHPVVLIFACSALLRLAIISWYIPRSRELRVRHRPDILQVVYRISRFTPGAGVVLDWLTVTRKQRGDDSSADE